jgi:hypothetical protein
MATDDAQRQQLIHAAMASRVGEVPDVALQLWPLLSLQLASIIGEGGFKSLYDRSLYLTRTTHPWLMSVESSDSLDNRFAELKASLASADADEAGKASHMLILTFTNILASLIGEHLTIDILKSAWGNRAPGPDIAGKESPHEQ